MVGLVLQTNGSLWEAFSGTGIPWELVLPVDIPQGVSRSAWGNLSVGGVSWVCAAAAPEPEIQHWRLEAVAHLQFHVFKSIYS